MKTEKIANLCPKCQAPLPANAPQGLCAKCLLAAAATPTEAGQPPGERWTPPPLGAVALAFPHLELLQLIGVGGMGAVYKARQPKLDRLVALKILPQALAGDAAFAERFNREARLLARLNHPGIVSVHDYGETGGFFYLLMEFVDGVNLRQAMKAGRFSPQQALFLVPKICEALQFAHDEGILHRDIKPENILLDTRGRVKIADFGIAKLMGEKSKGATLTASGLAVGTPHYMAPEQLEHPQDVDQRADIYSLGVVFYEMLTGELPIGRFAPPSQKTPLDPRVDEVVLRALEKERERRQHSVAEVKTEVEQITATPVAPAKAAGLAESTSAAPAPKTSLCYVSTPEYLRTFRGRFLYIYQGKGELRLDNKTLSFTSGWQSQTIPLVSIRSLALGEYSIAAKPVPLHYLEVSFEEQGVSRILLFTPTRNALLPVWDTNKVVAEWASALQAAVRKSTGRSLTLNRSSRAQGLAWGELLKGFLFTAALCSLVFAIIPVITEQRLPNRLTDFIWGVVVAGLTLAGLLSMRLFQWRQRRDLLRDGNLAGLTQFPEVSPQVGPSGTQVLHGSGTAQLPGQSPPVSLGMHVLYLLVFLVLCFLMIGPWIGDFTGTQFPYPLPDSVGKPLAWLTLLLVIYGAIHKSWRQAEAKRRAAASDASNLPSAARTNNLPTAHEAEPRPRQAVVGDPVRAELRAGCYFSTPERMRNCFPGPQAHIFQCKGELRFDGVELVFISPWQTRVVIPVKEIRNLSIGQFQMWTTPWVMKYGRFNFLSVTFVREGQERTVHLTPVPDGAPSTERANTEVAAWFEEIRQAAAALVGAAPMGSVPAAVTYSAERPWNRKGLPLLAGFLVCDALWVWQLTRPTSSLGMTLVVVPMLLLLMGAVWFCHGFLAADRAIKRGVFDKITSDDPPGDLSSAIAGASSSDGKLRRPFWWTASAWVFIGIGLLAVIDTMAMLYRRPFDFTFYPGWAHLFAGVALLTLNRRWRAVALVTLSLSVLVGAYVSVDMAMSPQKASVVVLAFMGMKPVSVMENPYVGAAVGVFLALLLFWPCYLLLCQNGRRLFGIVPKK